MDKENERYAAYVSILKEELIPGDGMYGAHRAGLCGGECCPGAGHSP